MRNEYRRLATLYDIKLFSERIIAISTDLTKEQLEEDYVKLDAVHHNFAKVGEATNRILQYDPVVAAKLKTVIPKIRAVVDFRNVLLHDYAKVNINEVWGIITNYLPTFHQAITDLLIEFDPPVSKPDEPSSGPQFRM